MKASASTLLCATHYSLMPMTDDEQPEPVRYTYKPSVAGSPQSFELSGEGLSIQTGFRASLWRYGDIAQIRLSYRPVSMLAPSLPRRPPPQGRSENPHRLGDLVAASSR